MYDIIFSHFILILVFDLVHEIDVSDLDMGPVVGKGQFGVVHRASWRGTPVAVKKISIMGSRKDEIEKEVAIHRYPDIFPSHVYC